MNKENVLLAVEANPWGPFLEGYKFVETDQEGGEGQGDHYHFVYRVLHIESHASILVKIDGFHDSWNGTEFHEAAYECVPVQKTITVYEKV